MMDRTIDLDLWGDGAADRLPRITITPTGLRPEIVSDFPSIFFLQS